MAKKEKTSPKPVEKKVAEKKPVEKKVDEKKVAEKTDKIEGLTKETEESGIIAFKAGSGSNDLLALISKYGFDRKKVLERAAVLKEKGKAFEDCEPAKKYNKVAGIIKKLQNAGYKLPTEN